MLVIDYPAFFRDKMIKFLEGNKLIPSKFYFRASGIAQKLLPPSFYCVLGTSSSNVNMDSQVSTNTPLHCAIHCTVQCTTRQARSELMTFVFLCNHLWKKCALFFIKGFVLIYILILRTLTPDQYHFVFISFQRGSFLIS